MLLTEYYFVFGLANELTLAGRASKKLPSVW